MDTLFTRQKPWLSGPPPLTNPRGPAWWPGGRIGQKALRAAPLATMSTAWVTAPALCSAASNVFFETVVSPSRLSMPLARSASLPTFSHTYWMLRMYDHSCTRSTSDMVALGASSTQVSLGARSAERREPLLVSMITASLLMFSGGAEGCSVSLGGHV